MLEKSYWILFIVLNMLVETGLDFIQLEADLLFHNIGLFHKKPGDKCFQ